MDFLGGAFVGCDLASEGPGRDRGEPAPAGPALVQRRQNPTTVVRAWVPAVPAVLVAPPGWFRSLVTLGRSLLGSSGRFFK